MTREEALAAITKALTATVGSVDADVTEDTNLVDDGLLDCVEIGDVHGLARIPLFARALRGAHLAHPRVRARRRSHFALAFTGAPWCDLDGELVQLASRDCDVRAVPRALRVVAR